MHCLSSSGRRDPDELTTSGLDRSGLPRPEKDHSRRGRAVPLGMPSVHVPAKLCDSSPLAVTP